MTAVPVPTDSIARVDLLLGQATMLTATRWDDAAALVREAMGIALPMAATHPSDTPPEVPDLADLGVGECLDRALREVQSWDLSLAAELPDLARLRVALADARDALAAGSPARRGR